MGIVSAIIVGVLIIILANETTAWMPRIRSSLVRIAAKLSPKEYRERLVEEWTAHLDSLPGELAKTLVAMDFIRSGLILGLRGSDAVSSALTRIIDVLLATSVIIISVPVLMVVFIAVRLDGQSQEVPDKVVGKGGREFFLNMVRAKGQLGLFLKRSRLDEVTILMNVLRGEMRLVGPRPRRASELCRLGASSEKYLRSGPGMFNPPAQDFQNNVDLADIAYLEQRSVLGDLEILAKGFWSVLFPEF